MQPKMLKNIFASIILNSSFSHIEVSIRLILCTFYSKPKFKPKDTIQIMKVYVHLEQRQNLITSFTYIAKISPEAKTTANELLQLFLLAYFEKYPCENSNLKEGLLALDNLSLSAMETGTVFPKHKPISKFVEDGGDVVVTILNDELETSKSGTVEKPNIRNECSQQQKAVNPIIVKALSTAEEYRLKNNWRMAKNVWQSILSDVDVGNIDALCGIGDIHFNNDEFDQAIVYFQKALEKYRNSIPTTNVSKIDVVIKLGKSKINANQIENALSYLDKELLRLNQPKCASKTDDEIRIRLLMAEALYKMNAECQEVAIGIMSDLIEHSDTENNTDLVLLYSRAAHDRGKRLEAMQMILKVLVSKSNDKKVKEQFVEFLNSENGLNHIIASLRPSPESGPAYAFLGIIAKEHSALKAAAACLSYALEFKPSSSTYILNLVHIIEIQNDYQKAFDKIRLFCQENKKLSIRSQNNISCELIYRIIKNIKYIHEDESDISKAKNIEWIKGDIPYAKIAGGSELRLKDQNIVLSDQELDLFALFFTVVKILFSVGYLSVIPDLIQLIEPARYGHQLHLTNIRNEAAYYCCIAQLLSIREVPLNTAIRSLKRNDSTVYVCGDSHTLATAWREIIVNDTMCVLQPALVTGLKHWHLRPNSTFYPKQNFYNVIQSIPKGSRVVFLFGEIDCREGILLAVEKCRYKDIDEGIQHTAGIYMEALRAVVSKSKLIAYVHPIVPVLNETRQIVKKYNMYLKQCVMSSNFCTWLDFFDHLLDASGSKLAAEYELDGTHLHPIYLQKLLSNELMKT